MQRDVAPGIHRVEDAFVNFYVVEGDGRAVTVVDAGHPLSYGALRLALGEIGRSLDDVEALVLTHAHFDHVGFAERARRELDVPVWIHERDRSLSRHPWHHESEHSKLRHARYPKAVAVLAAMLAKGARFTPGLTDVRGFVDEDTLDVPGRPQPVYTPGHTHGHVALHFADRDAVVVGDALVTFNPYTGGHGPQIVSGAATLDSTEAIASLQRIAETDATTLLPGHGDPWTTGAEEAVRLAREAGPS
jgi:glyoxylase-like metal-dependent hydrolase (beta-lactamase superfamily II)